MSSDAPSHSQEPEGRFRSFGLKSHAPINTATGSMKKAGKQVRKLVKPRPIPKEQTTKGRDSSVRSSTRLSPFSWISNRIRKAATSKSSAPSLNVPPSIDEHGASRRSTIYRLTSTADDNSSGISQLSVYFPHVPPQPPDVEHPLNDDSDKSKGSNTSIEAVELVQMYTSIQVTQSPSSSPANSPSRPRPRVPSKAAKHLGSIPSLNAASSFSSLYESQRSSQPPPPPPKPQFEVQVTNTKPFPASLTLSRKPAITSLNSFFHSSTSTSISQLITNRIHHAATKPSSTSSSRSSESSLSIDTVSARRVTIRRVVSFASSISGLSQLSFYFPHVHPEVLDDLAVDGKEDDGSEKEKELKEKESEVSLEAVELFEIFTSIRMPEPERLSSSEVEEGVKSQINQPHSPSLNIPASSGQEPNHQEKAPSPTPSPSITPPPPSLSPLSSHTHTPPSLSHIFLSPPHLLPLRPPPLPHSSPFEFIPFQPFLPSTSRYSTPNTYLGLIRRTGEVVNSRRMCRFGLVPYLVPVRREVHEIGIRRMQGEGVEWVTRTRVHVLPRLGAGSGGGMRSLVASRARFGASSLAATGTALTKTIFTPVGAASLAPSTSVKTKNKRVKKARRVSGPGDAVKPYIQKIANAAAVLTFIATPALKLLVG